eukprot:m.315159 g.315159  ORF g.315159 m.315159 type:complete len:1559 (+) comp27519_c1_seq2:384-5060(+)
MYLVAISHDNIRSSSRTKSACLQGVVSSSTGNGDNPGAETEITLSWWMHSTDVARSQVVQQARLGLEWSDTKGSSDTDMSGAQRTSQLLWLPAWDTGSGKCPPLMAPGDAREINIDTVCLPGDLCAVSNVDNPSEVIAQEFQSMQGWISRNGVTSFGRMLATNPTLRHAMAKPACTPSDRAFTGDTVKLHTSYVQNSTTKICKNTTFTVVESDTPGLALRIKSDPVDTAAVFTGLRQSQVSVVSTTKNGVWFATEGVTPVVCAPAFWMALTWRDHVQASKDGRTKQRINTGLCTCRPPIATLIVTADTMSKIGTSQGQPQPIQRGLITHDHPPRQLEVSIQSQESGVTQPTLRLSSHIKINYGDGHPKRFPRSGDKLTGALHCGTTQIWSDMEIDVEVVTNTCTHDQTDIPTGPEEYTELEVQAAQRTQNGEKTDLGGALERFTCECGARFPTIHGLRHHNMEDLDGPHTRGRSELGHGTWATLVTDNDTGECIAVADGIVKCDSTWADRSSTVAELMGIHGGLTAVSKCPEIITSALTQINIETDSQCGKTAIEHSIAQSLTRRKWVRAPTSQLADIVVEYEATFQQTGATITHIHTGAEHDKTRRAERTDRDRRNQEADTRADALREPAQKALNYMASDGQKPSVNSCGKYVATAFGAVVDGNLAEEVVGLYDYKASSGAIETLVTDSSGIPIHSTEQTCPQYRAAHVLIRDNEVDGRATLDAIEDLPMELYAPAMRQKLDVLVQSAQTMGTASASTHPENVIRACRTLTRNTTSCTLCGAAGGGFSGRLLRHAIHECPRFNIMRLACDAKISNILLRGLPTATNFKDAPELTMGAAPYTNWGKLNHFASIEAHPDIVTIGDMHTQCPTSLLDGYAHNIVTNKLWATRDSRNYPANTQQANSYVRSTKWAHIIAGIIDHSVTAAPQIPGRQLPASIVGWCRDVLGVEQQFNVPPLYCTAGVFDHPSVCCEGFHPLACDAVGMLSYRDLDLGDDWTRTNSLTIVEASSFPVTAWASRLKFNSDNYTETHHILVVHFDNDISRNKLDREIQNCGGVHFLTAQKRVMTMFTATGGYDPTQTGTIPVPDEDRRPKKPIHRSRHRWSNYMGTTGPPTKHSPALSVPHDSTGTPGEVRFYIIGTAAHTILDRIDSKDLTSLAFYTAACGGPVTSGEHHNLIWRPDTKCTKTLSFPLLVNQHGRDTLLNSLANYEATVPQRDTGVYHELATPLPCVDIALPVYLRQHGCDAHTSRAITNAIVRCRVIFGLEIERESKRLVQRQLTAMGVVQPGLHTEDQARELPTPRTCHYAAEQARSETCLGEHVSTLYSDKRLGLPDDAAVCLPCACLARHFAQQPRKDFVVAVTRPSQGNQRGSKRLATATAPPVQSASAAASKRHAAMLSAGSHDIDAASEILRKFIATDDFKRSVLFFIEQAKPMRLHGSHLRDRTITVHRTTAAGRIFNSHRDITISNRKATFIRKGKTHHKSELTCAVIVKVRPGYAGALAGLQPGMIITAVDDNLVPTLTKDQLKVTSRQPASIAHELIDLATQSNGQVTLTIKE